MQRTFVVLLAIVVVAAGSFAATTGRMTGTVTDNEGIALPGVTVSISSDKLMGGTQVAITDVDGSFVFNILPIGLYRAEANLSGFRLAVAEEVRVVLDRAASVTFTLVPEQFAGEIEVTADVPVVDTAQVNTSVVFDTEYLQKAAVGSGNRDYLQIIGQAAGVAGSGNANVYGGTEGDNRILVDGMNTSDPLYGTFGTNFNYDAIQEISFQTGGFEAEFGQATGGIVNLVTKSGGNEFSGGLDARYRDQSFIERGDHFDPDVQTSSSRIISATLGGPILRDKVWFFVSVQNVLTQSQNEGAPVVREYTGWNYIGKATWQASDNHRVVLKYSSDPATIDGRNSSLFMTREASGTQEQGGDIYGVELNSVLSESLLLNAQIGRHDLNTTGFPTYGDLETIGHYNQDTGVYAGNYTSAYDADRGRDELRANLSLFVDDLLGAHELKVGGEYNDVYYTDISYFPGGAQAYDVNIPANFVDLNGDGFLTEWIYMEEPLETARDPQDADGELLTFFVQDAWRPHPNVTVKPGIRFDNVNMTNAVGETVADMDSWQPRFGIAWDIFGTAKHVVRVSGGRFMDSTALTIPDFASGIPYHYGAYTTMEYYCSMTGICDLAMLEAILGPSDTRTDLSGFTWVVWPYPEQSYIYDPTWTLDQAGYGHLEAPYADELIAAYETQLGHNTSLELTYVDKKTKNIIEDTCSNNTWIWDDSVPAPSLDDPSTWTTAGGCSRWILANRDDLYRQYTGYIAKFETRQERYHVMASYTWSESTGNSENGSLESYASGLGDYFPVEFINRDGYLPDDRRHRVKVNGYLMLPWDVTVGVDGFWSSPGRITMQAGCDRFYIANRDTPSALEYFGIDPDMLDYCFSGDGALLSGRDIYFEPRGSRETKSVWQLDLQVSKAFTIGAVSLEGIFTVQNVFDREQDANFNETAFLRDAAGEWRPIGQPTSYYSPRRYELGFRLEF